MSALPPKADICSAQAGCPPWAKSELNFALPPNVRYACKLGGLYPHPRKRFRGAVRSLASYVRFGSKADICSAQEHVRFTSESGPCAAQKMSTKKFKHHAFNVKTSFDGRLLGYAHIGGKLCEACTDLSLRAHLLLQFLLRLRRLKCSI